MAGTGRIRKDLVQWFVKNILAPSIMRLDTPGFVITTKNSQGRDIAQRNVFYSETQLAAFESALVREFGEEGKKTAYWIGKNAAYSYCQSFGVPRLGSDNEQAINDFIPFFLAYMGVTWGEFFNYTYDLKERSIEMEMDDQIVCRKNGLGYIITTGPLGGGWSYIMQDGTIEGSQPSCVGRKDPKCRVICAPAGLLRERSHPFTQAATDVTFRTDTEYFSMNRVRRLQHSKATLKSLISANFMSFTDNKLLFHGERYFFSGIELLYVMELAACKDTKVARLLFGSAYEQGESIARLEKGNEYSTFIPDLLAALGFGDTIISHSTGKFAVQANYFPYLSAYEQIDFHYYKGLLSGLLSGFAGTKVELRKHYIDVSGGHISLNLS